MKTYVSHDLTDTAEIAKEWLISISNKYGSKDEALVVGLSGHLGAGKTAFTKEIAKLLDVKEDVTSPTFVIMKMYQLQAESPWKRLVHIDAYRLERREELEVLEWEKLVADKNNLILVEWPENVGLKECEPQANLKFEARGEERSIAVT